MANNKKFYLPVCILFTLSTSFSVLANKPNCEQELLELRRLQSLMRSGNSSEYTREKERHQHKLYQSCRRAKNSHNANTLKGSEKKVANAPAMRSGYISKPVRSELVKNSPINIKGRYKGEKQQAWVNYYVPPKHCKKPKSTAQFSKCLTHRDEAALTFDAEWRKSQAPPSFKLEQ